MDDIQERGVAGVRRAAIGLSHTGDKRVVAKHYWRASRAHWSIIADGAAWDSPEAVAARNATKVADEYVRILEE